VVHQPGNNTSDRLKVAEGFLEVLACGIFVLEILKMREKIVRDMQKKRGGVDFGPLKSRKPPSLAVWQSLCLRRRQNWPGGQGLLASKA
jgi:hypothetical protein